MRRRFFTAQTAQILWSTLWTWGPSLAMMAALFAASAQPKYDPPDGDTARMYFSGWTPIFPGLWDTFVKKGAHVLVYGILALLNLRALTLSGMRLRQTAYFAIALTAGYALLDELHQAFVPGRHASVLDIGFDCIGALLFMYAATYVARRRGGLRAGP